MNFAVLSITSMPSTQRQLGLIQLGACLFYSHAQI